MPTKPVTVFYSWQSDLPAPLNRTFIGSALERAVKPINIPLTKDVTITVALDRDTSGKLGAPDIAATIYEKINQADIFIADVSLINNSRRSKTRLMPNPNVMCELGYAAGKLGWERVVCVINTAFGTEDQLPFDIRGRRLLKYNLRSRAIKKVERDALAISLRAAITPLIESAWKAHRPHAMRFTAYLEISALVNSFFFFLSALYVNTRIDPHSATFDEILDPITFSETLQWAYMYAPYSSPVGDETTVEKQTISQAQAFTREAEHVLNRYGDKLDPEVFEILYRLIDCPMIGLAKFIHEMEGLDIQRHTVRPRTLGEFIQADADDLTLLKRLMAWCVREHKDLKVFDDGLRTLWPPAIPKKGGIWRANEQKLEEENRGIKSFNAGNYRKRPGDP